MDPNAMNVDNPNSQYSTPFVHAISVLAQTDNDALTAVLRYLAEAVPTRSFDIHTQEIEKLNMVDLRPLLASGQFAIVAKTVVERLSPSENPFHCAAVTEGGRELCCLHINYFFKIM